jgi:hypothetical protein
VIFVRGQSIVQVGHIGGEKLFAQGVVVYGLLADGGVMLMLQI